MRNVCDYLGVGTSGTTRVEMLWEPYDAAEVLRDRFGHADVATAAGWVATVLKAHWDVDVVTCERVVMSDANALAWVTTAAGGLVAKWSVAPPRFARLARVAALTRWLHERGIPVSAPLPSLDGSLQVEVDGVSVSVQRVVAADLLDVGDPAQVRAAGAVLAHLHGALAAYPIQVATPPEHPDSLATRIGAWLDTVGPQVPADVRDDLRRRLPDGPEPLPVQLVHGDYRSSNVLCADGRVAAVLDLEETRLDHCVVEVARSAVMLGTRFRDWGPVPTDVHETFVAGYVGARPWTPDEAAWWEAVVRWQAWALVPEGDDPTGWGPSAAGLGLSRPAAG